MPNSKRTAWIWTAPRQLVIDLVRAIILGLVDGFETGREKNVESVMLASHR